MLENNYRETLNRLLSAHPCQVAVPENWRESLPTDAQLAVMAIDRRRFVRRNLPGQALLEIEQTLPAIVRPWQMSLVLTKDISRTGISFLHSEQLFPAERFLLWLPTRRMPMQVIRCLRYNPKCFEVAAQFQSV